MVRLLVPILVLLALLGLSIAADKPAPKADFTFINRADVTTLDLVKMSWQQDLRVGRLVHEGLVRNDVFRWDYAVGPGVAEKWDISADGLTYTFHLRADAKWSNGDKVKASDFVYSWRRALLPDNAADYTGFFLHIKGAQEFFDRRTKALTDFASDSTIPNRAVAAKAIWDRTIEDFATNVGLVAVDDRTLVVTLARPVPYFIELCAFPVLSPVYPPLVQRYEHINATTGMIETEQGWTKPPESVQNGPFVVASWRFKRDMRLEQNPHYWNRDVLAIRSIQIPTIEEPNAQVLAFRSGSVDWVTDVQARYTPEMVRQKQQFYGEHKSEVEQWKREGVDPIEIDRRLPSDPRNLIHVFPAFGLYFYNFNCQPTLPDGRPNPFHDPRVRRAFSMAVDRKALTEQIRRLGEPVADTFIPPESIGGYTSPTGLRTDIEAAKKLLADAGFPGGSGFINVDILFTRDGGHELIAQAIAKDWKQNLGVSCTLSQKEIKSFREDMKNKNYIVGRASWFGDYGDPTTFLDLHRTGDGNNDRGYSNPAFDAMLEQAAVELDPAKRMAILSKAEALMLEDAPVLPLFQYGTTYMFDATKFTGISSHPRDEQQLYRVDVFGDGRGSDVPLFLPARSRDGGMGSPRVD